MTLATDSPSWSPGLPPVMGGGRLTLTGSAEDPAKGVGAPPPPARGRVSSWRGGVPGLEAGGPFPDGESALENLAVPETAPHPGPRRHLLALRPPTCWQPVGREWRCSREGLQGGAPERCSREVPLGRCPWGGAPGRCSWGGAPGHHGGQQKADQTVLEARGQGLLLPASLQSLVLGCTR